MASSLSAPAFRRQIGPFALVRRPPDPVMQQLSVRMAAGRTGEQRRGEKNRPIDTALAFDELLVLTLPPIGERMMFVLGRLPDCEIVIDHPSVSKRHAELSWEEGIRRCSVKDLDSRNGTMLNDNLIRGGEYIVSDDDLLGFGDESFWYLLAETLQQRLAGIGGERRRL